MNLSIPPASARSARRRLASVALTLGCLATPLMAQSQDTGERGRDGRLEMIYWQAPSTLNPYLSSGAKDTEAASIVLEPLARHDATGAMVPWLATEIPTLDNGGVSEDLTRITWTLREDITWSDGSAFTAEDVAFTWRYCTAPGTGCAQADMFDDVAEVTAPDARRVEIRFTTPKPYPYQPFVGAQAPILQAAQFAECLGPEAAGCSAQNFAPIGTGPYRVAEFHSNDTVLFEANPAYRDPAKPAFAEISLKGGGTPTEAARAVLEAGAFDYAWNLQLPPDLLSAMAAAGHGTPVVAFGAVVERLVVNFSDPDPALGEARATFLQQHPILSDRLVREALSLAIDRAALVDLGYGDTGRVTCNILPPTLLATEEPLAPCPAQDLDAARARLDEAGWTDSDGDGIRDKDGTPLRLLFQTTTNAVRQDFQMALKHWWGEIGIDTELRHIDASVFFGGDTGSPDTMQKFFADIQMYAASFTGTDPEAYLAGWTCSSIPRPENQWQGSNTGRWCHAEFDALLATLAQTAGLAARAALIRQLNDLLVQDYAVIPLVDRGRVSAHLHDLKGVVMNSWDSEFWNIADWHKSPVSR